MTVRVFLPIFLPRKSLSDTRRHHQYMEKDLSFLPHRSNDRMYYVTAPLKLIAFLLIIIHETSNRAFQLECKAYLPSPKKKKKFITKMKAGNGIRKNCWASYLIWSQSISGERLWKQIKCLTGPKTYQLNHISVQRESLWEFFLFETMIGCNVIETSGIVCKNNHFFF